MKIIGIDLSGPANHQDTVMIVFELQPDKLTFDQLVVNASDEKIISILKEIAAHDEIAIGIDAPLSYQDGGGDRPQDKSLRKWIKTHGLSGNSIMTPTMTKMVYLTLRGIGLTRRIMASNAATNIRIVEVHPGAAIGTRIGAANIEHALKYKQDIISRRVVFDWLSAVGLQQVPEDMLENSHRIDACAAALAAWHWADEGKQPTWLWNEKTSAHPFEFCC